MVTNLGSALSHEVEDGVSGMLCSFADVRGLAELILELLRSPDLRKRLGAEGETVVRQRFSQQVALEGFNQLLQQLTCVSND